MKTQISSIFNLIQLFTTPIKNVKAKFGKSSNCETDFHKDYYCEVTGKFVKVDELVK